MGRPRIQICTYTHTHTHTHTSRMSRERGSCPSFDILDGGCGRVSVLLAAAARVVVSLCVCCVCVCVCGEADDTIEG